MSSYSQEHALGREGFEYARSLRRGILHTHDPRSRPFLAVAPSSAEKAWRREGGAYSSWPATATSQLDFYQGTAIHLRKSRQRTRCWMHTPPPPDPPQCFCSLVIKLLRKLAKEAGRMPGLLMQFIQYIRTRPETEKARLAMKKVQDVVRRIALKICNELVLALDDSSVNGKSRQRNPPPPPETPCFCSVFITQSRKLANEVVRMAGLILQCVGYMWSQPELKNVRNIYHKLSEWMRTWLEANKVQAKIRLTIIDICTIVVSATTEHPSAPSSAKGPSAPSAAKGPSAPSAAKGPSAHSAPSAKCPLAPSAAKRPSAPSAPSATKHPSASGTESKSSFQEKEASDSTSTQPSPEVQPPQPPSPWSKSLKKIKRAVNKLAREVRHNLIMEQVMIMQKELITMEIMFCMWTSAFLICLMAFKNRAAVCEKAVACLLLAGECKNAILRYDLPDKMILAGTLLRDNGVKVLEACKNVEKTYMLSEKLLLAWVNVQEAEKAYKLSEKLLLAWVKVQEAGKVAETLATNWASMEKVLLVVQKLTKGSKSP